MERNRSVSLVLLGTIFSSIILLQESKQLSGYSFPVYSTLFCPKNEAEWNKRSSALNCSERNGYMCLPNQQLTVLLEFCYTEPIIWIEEGVCLYLVKHVSKVNGYNCHNFTYGCHNSSYLSNRIFENPACTSIGYGCFLAEESCKRSTTAFPKETTKQILTGNTPSNDTDYGVWIGVSLGILFISCVFIILYFRYRRNGRSVFKRNNDVEHSTVIELQPILTKKPHNENKPTQKEMYQDEIFELWQQENTMFIPTKASEEVEKISEITNLVIVTGNSGSGKSAIIQHIALKYRERGWNVIPVSEVNEIIKDEPSESKMFVFDDPIGKESFDEISHNSWMKNERKLEARLKKVNLLISCRKCVLKDPRVKGLFNSDSNIVDIDDDKLKLNDDEKQKIFKQYIPDIRLSQTEYAEIMKIKTYFPLLCNLYSSNNKYQEDGLRFFKEPVEVFKEEIQSFRNADKKEKYCALVLLIFFNNYLCIDDLLGNDTSATKFRHSLELCGMETNTAPYTIGDHLKSLEGFFVKKIGDTFQFYHDFVMEVTTSVFGTDYPKDLINYADIGFLRRRVKLENCIDKKDPLTLHLSEKYILCLGNRFFSDILSNRLLDVVLNPCLRNKRVVEFFKKEVKNYPEKLKMLTEKKIIRIEKQQTSKNLFLSKIEFVSLENEISPLCALIVFCHTDLSLYCLKQMNAELLDGSLFSAICCNGSMDLFNVFSKHRMKEVLIEKWKYLYPIHIASVFHNYEILRELIRFKVDVNLQTDEDGSSPLMLAAGNDIKENLDYKADKLSENMREETIQVLLENNGDINLCRKDGASPLYLACQRGHVKTTKRLLKEGADINLCVKIGAGPLYAASENGHYDTVQLLLNKGADINLCTRYGAPPLYAASLNGHYEIVELLLKNSANINLCMEDGDSPLYAASLNGHYHIVQLLVNNGADINLCKQNSENPLFIASEKGHYSIVQTLLEKGANINELNKFEVTPLYLACQNGHSNTVQLMLNNGADVNFRKTNGESPVYVASRNGHDNTLQLLLKKGAGINLNLKNGESPLYAACEFGHQSTVQLILNNRGEINHCRDDGESPLYVACKNGHDSTVQLLLKNEADINIFTKCRLSPLDAARSNNHASTEDILHKSGASLFVQFNLFTNRRLHSAHTETEENRNASKDKQ